MNSTTWAELALRLSGDLPLALHAFHNQTLPGLDEMAMNPTVSRRALLHSPRIQSLSIGLRSDTPIDSESMAYLNESRSPLQQLTTLRVFRVPIEEPTLGRAPHLRRLVLSGTHIDINARILSPTIAELAFIHAGVSETSEDGDIDILEPFPGPYMLRALQPLTSLRRLFLLSAGDDMPWVAERLAAAARITLPQLEYIRIGGLTRWRWPLFIDRLDVPTNTRIDVRSAPFPHDRAPFESALPLASIHRVWGADASFTRVHVVPEFFTLKGTAMDYIAITKCAVVLSGLSSQTQNAPRGLTVSLDIAMHASPNDPFPLLDKSAIPCLSKLEELYVHHSELDMCYTAPMQAINEWTRTMRAHPSLRYISAAGVAAETLLEVIGASPGEFSGLQVLALQRADLGWLEHTLRRHGGLRVVVSECVPLGEPRAASLKELAGDRVNWRLDAPSIDKERAFADFEGALSQEDKLFECPKELRSLSSMR